MIRRNGDLLLEDDAARGARMRKASLYRAALAFVLMGALLVWLMLADDSATPADEAPTPSLSIPATLVAPATLAESSDQTHLEHTESAPAVEPAYPAWQSNPVSIPETTAVSSVINAEPAPVAATQPAPRSVSTDADKDKAPVKIAITPTTVASAPAAAADTAGGFRVQLGQFNDMQAATTLRDTLLSQGYAVQLQVRVGTGPYTQRKGAESALAKMRSEHGLGGLIVAPPSGKGFMVQLGVFSEPGNADELAVRVKVWGYMVQQHARVMVGPYHDRKSAQAALQTLQRERKMEGLVIMPAT